MCMWTPDEPEWKSFLRAIGWRRSLAIVVWLLCVLGSFLPTSPAAFVYPIIWAIRIYPPASIPLTLLGISIPLALVLVGSWWSDDDESGFKRAFGIVIEIDGWLGFARVFGLFALGPLISMIS